MQDTVPRRGAQTSAEIRRNLAWTGLAAVMTVAFGLAVVGIVTDAVRGEWLSLLGLPVFGAVWFWIAGGAWKRTTWGISAR